MGQGFLVIEDRAEIVHVKPAFKRVTYRWPAFVLF
jgi:hypothetical protein